MDFPHEFLTWEMNDGFSRVSHYVYPARKRNFENEENSLLEKIVAFVVMIIALEMQDGHNNDIGRKLTQVKYMVNCCWSLSATSFK
jgi:hypothetical protein